MAITGERFLFRFRNQAVVEGYFEVRLLFDYGSCDGTKPASPKGCIISGSCLGDNQPIGGMSFASQSVLCKPSVRSEVEKVVKDYMFRCGIDMHLVVQEIHELRMETKEYDGHMTSKACYDFIFGGMPGKRQTQYSLRFGNQVLDRGVVNVDIKYRAELLKQADELLSRYRRVKYGY